LAERCLLHTINIKLRDTGLCLAEALLFSQPGITTRREITTLVHNSINLQTQKGNNTMHTKINHSYISGYTPVLRFIEQKQTNEKTIA